MLRHERRAWDTGYARVAGVDEAGRGPLAGPVVAAAVVFERAFVEREAGALFHGLTDSKQLSPARRERFFELLHQQAAVRLACGQADVAEIDALNILRATHLAMARALSALRPAAEFALVDGLPVTGLPCPSLAIVQGDARSLSIAAASVVAKVTRDRLMRDLDRTCPGYGFAEHKGYGTAAHLAALRRLGPTPHHRRTFGPVRQLQLDLSK